MDAFKLAQLAKTKGYALAVKNGKVQFQTVVYNKKGTAQITRHTDFITVTEAQLILAVAA
jgi:hypothetical protein